MNKVKAVSLAVSASLAAVCASYMAEVVKDSRKNYSEYCDWLLILGGNVIGADTPGPHMLARMKRAAEYLNEHPYTKAVPCGGCFREQQKKSEARIIADYLIANGVEEERIFPEENSTTTFENFIFAKKIIEDFSGESIDNLNIGFLSSDYHIHRASVIAHRRGFENIVRVSAPIPDGGLKSYVREMLVAAELIYHR